MNRHRIDLLSLFFGLMFAGIGGVFLVGGVDVTDLGADWIWPLPLILAGLMILAAAFRRGVESPEPVATADDPGPDYSGTGADELRADDPGAAESPEPSQTGDAGDDVGAFADHDAAERSNTTSVDVTDPDEDSGRTSI